MSLCPWKRGLKRIHEFHKKTRNRLRVRKLVLPEAQKTCRMVSFMVYIDDHVYYSYNSFRKISRKLDRKEITQNEMAIGVTIREGGRHKELFFYTCCFCDL